MDWQECFQSGVDTECTPTSAEGGESFPMDANHGFGVVHDKVWDGSLEEPSTGLCAKGTPDEHGRYDRGLTTSAGILVLLRRSPTA